jgi:O-antigen/teichoic acid export membrane protein
VTRFSFLRIAAFDTSTEQGRHLERYRRAALTTMLSVLARGASLAVLFVSLRVALPYLGQARFGVWMTISSLTTVLLVFDFGIGNSMVSRVANLVARGDEPGLIRQIAYGLAVLSGIGIVVGGVLAAVAAWAPIAWLYRGATPGLVAEARSALMVFCVLFGLSIPLQTAHRIYAGLQEGYFALATAGVMSLVSLLLLPFLPGLHAGIRGFLLATYGLQVASGAVLVLALHRRFRLALPERGELRRDDLRTLLSSGGLFFLLQVAGVIGWDMDATLVSALIGPAAVAIYSVVQQMFLLVSGPLAMLNAPLWGSYADAHARGEVRYLRTTLRRSMLGTFGIATVGVAVIAALHTPLSHLLTKDVVQVSGTFVVIFGLWTVVSATGGALAMYLNGLHILLPQVGSSLSFVAVALLLKLLLIGPYGLPGVVSATLLSYLLTVAVPYLTVFRKTLAAPLRA